MITNQGLSNEIKREWFLLPYYKKVELFNSLADLSSRLRVPVRLYYNDYLGFYAEFREELKDEVIGLFGFNDLHSNDMSQQYLALSFISTLDYYLNS